MAKTDELTLTIDGLRCASCVSSVEKGLAGQPGVETCRVNLATKSATVSYDSLTTDPQGIINQIEKMGFSAAVGRPDFLAVNQREMIEALRLLQISVVLTIPLAAVAMWPMWAGRSLVPTPYDALTQAVLAAVVLLYGGRTILLDAAKQTRHLRANMNSLIAMGTTTAFGGVHTYLLSTGSRRYRSLCISNQ